MNTSTTPKVEYSYANGSANTIRMTDQQRGTFQQQCGLDSVGWTFLSVDGAVIEWWIEDSINSDKNVQATGNMVGIPNPPATTTGTTPAWDPFTESQWNSFTEAQWNAFTLDSGTVPTQLSARYDAWNRLVEIRNGATTLVENVYDARGYRIRKDTWTSGSVSESRHYYYTPGWQCVEERVGTTTTAERQFVWGLRYIDDLILRDRSTANNGTMNERRYGMQDGNWNMIAICDTTGAVTERFAYSAYGAPVFMTGAGTVQTSSASGFETLYAGYRWDGESPLMYYARNRFLLPAMGTWNRRDLLALSNLYEVESANPVRRVDAFGLLDDDGWNWDNMSDDEFCEYHDPRPRPIRRTWDGEVCNASNWPPEPLASEQLHEAKYYNHTRPCGSIYYDDRTHYCENGSVLNLVTIYVVNRDGGRGHIAGHMNTHIDLLIPGLGVIGYFGENPPSGQVPSWPYNMPGTVNNGSEWLNGSAPRPNYVTNDPPGAAYLSTIVSLQIKQAQYQKLVTAAQTLNRTPGTFNIAVNNCAWNASSMLAASGIIEPGMRSSIPAQLIDNTASRGTKFTGYTIMSFGAVGTGQCCPWTVYNKDKNPVDRGVWAP